MRSHLPLAAAIALALFLSGCADPARLKSDLARFKNIGETENAMRASIAAELSPQSTIENGRKWFRRHGVPLRSETPDNGGGLTLSGGFKPFETVGFWYAGSLGVSLLFGADGHFIRGDAACSQSCL